MREEVGSKVASDVHGRTGFEGDKRGRGFLKKKREKSVCDKDGEEGKRGDVKLLPDAEKVAKRRRLRALRTSYFDCFDLPRLVSGVVERFSANQIWDGPAHTSTPPLTPSNLRLKKIKRQKKTVNG